MRESASDYKNMSGEGLSTKDRKEEISYGNDYQ